MTNVVARVIISPLSIAIARAAELGERLAIPGVDILSGAVNTNLDYRNILMKVYQPNKELLGYLLPNAPGKDAKKQGAAFRNFMTNHVPVLSSGPPVLMERSRRLKLPGAQLPPWRDGRTILLKGEGMGWQQTTTLQGVILRNADEPLVSTVARSLEVFSAATGSSSTYAVVLAGTPYFVPPEAVAGRLLLEPTLRNSENLVTVSLRGRDVGGAIAGVFEVAKVPIDVHTSNGVTAYDVAGRGILSVRHPWERHESPYRTAGPNTPPLGPTTPPAKGSVGGMDYTYDPKTGALFIPQNR